MEQENTAINNSNNNIGEEYFELIRKRKNNQWEEYNTYASYFTSALRNCTRTIIPILCSNFISDWIIS